MCSSDLFCMISSLLNLLRCVLQCWNNWTSIRKRNLDTDTVDFFFVWMSSCSNTVCQKDYSFSIKLPFLLCQRSVNRGFPGGAVVESLPASAGDTGSSPGLGGSHMPRSSWAREPQLLGLCVWSLCSAAGEAAMVRGPRTAMRSGPRLPLLENALAQKQRPNTAKNK